MCDEKASEMPFYSVIIPVYNVEKYLKECIDSILTQRHSSFEVLIVDDGSTDNSGKICDEYTSDPRIRVFHKKNGGLSDARNFATSFIRGQYVCYIDSDDYFDSDNFFYKSECLLKEHPETDVLTFGYKKLFEETGHIQTILPNIAGEYEFFSFQELSRNCLFVLSACEKFFRASLIRSGGLTFEKGVVSEDMVWCVKLALCAKNYLVKAEAPYVYRQRQGSISHTSSERTVDDLEKNFIQSLTLVEKSFLNEDERRAFYGFISQFYSMYTVNLALLPIRQQREHYDFLDKYSWILRYGVRIRERVLRMMFALFGKQGSLKLIYMAAMHR